MDLGINGKTALVIGASRGMGAAVARDLMLAGCKVAGVAREGERLNAMREALHKAYACDITSEEQVHILIGRVHADLGVPDIIVHVTGGSMGIRDHMLPWSEWQKVLQLNLGAAHEINRAFLPALVERGWGRIVHFSSNGVKLGTGRAPYVAAKHAVEGYVQIMAREFSAKGVIFSAVSPGPIYTPGLFIYSQPEDWTKDFMAKYMPIGRWGQDEDVAAAVALLCSERGGYMAGAVLPVDGGMR